MSALDLAIQTGLLAFLFGLIVLLPLLEEPVGRVVVRQIFWSLCFFHWIGRDTAVAGLELFQKPAVSLRSVLALGVILGAFLFSFAVLHQPCILPITVRPYTTRQGE